jgi:cell division protein FtsB
MATTRQPRQFIAVWNDAGTEVKGATFEESLFVDGDFWKNELTSVAPVGFGDFGTLFSNQLQVQHDALVAEVATLEAGVAALTAQVASLEASNASLTAQKAEVDELLATRNQELTTANASLSAKTSEAESLLADKSIALAANATLTSEKATLTSEKATLTASLAAANARIATLLEEIPFDPRIIDATAFYNRLTKDELLVFVSSEDAQVRAIGQTIAAYKANDWPVVFASTEFQQMVGYLQSVEVLTEARLEELTRDATRAEAYSVE